MTATVISQSNPERVVALLPDYACLQGVEPQLIAIVVVHDRRTRGRPYSVIGLWKQSLLGFVAGRYPKASRTAPTTSAIR